MNAKTLAKKEASKRISARRWADPREVEYPQGVILSPTAPKNYVRHYGDEGKELGARTVVSGLTFGLLAIIAFVLFVVGQGAIAMALGILSTIGVLGDTSRRYYTMNLHGDSSYRIESPKQNAVVTDSLLQQVVKTWDSYVAALRVAPPESRGAFGQDPIQFQQECWDVASTVRDLKKFEGLNYSDEVGKKAQVLIRDLEMRARLLEKAMTHTADSAISLSLSDELTPNNGNLLALVDRAESQAEGLRDAFGGRLALESGDSE